MYICNGLKNQFMSSITVSDVISTILRGLRDVYFLISLYESTSSNKKKIICYPRRPLNPLYTLAKVRWGLPVRFTSSPELADIELYFYDKTNSNYQVSENPKKIVINKNCTDISKSNVDRVFLEIFGYSLSLDPKNFHGSILEKSEQNAKHDGKIINSSSLGFKIYKNKVYQKLINNIYNEFAIDYRVVWVKDEIVLAYVKFAQKEYRFKSKTVYSKIVSICSLFENEEISLINEFCKKFKLDFGELDILRDRDTKKIYIVDVNKTAWGPPDKISLEDGKKAIALINDKFRKSYLI